MKKYLISSNGMTLVELIMVIVIVGTIAGFVGNIIFYEINTYNIVTSRKTGTQNARFASQYMAKEIRLIADPDSIFQANSDSLRFSDLDGNTIRYKLVSGELLRNSDLLLQDITAFSFDYFDGSGTLLTQPISDLSEIRSVTFQLTTSHRGQEITSRVNVTPRNF